MSHLQLALKRTFDVVAASVGILLLTPLLLTITLLLKVRDRGPVFFRGNRVGIGGQPFKIWKFRTMVANAAKAGPGITSSRDPRVTPIGSVLRRYKLDELPQLFNVLAGQMSIVGPRPEDPRYVALYTPEQRTILNVKPGITSPASIHFRSEEALLSDEDWERTYTSQLMPAKIDMDLNYSRKATLLSDFGIILKTLAALIK